MRSNISRYIRIEVLNTKRQLILVLIQLKYIYPDAGLLKSSPNMVVRKSEIKHPFSHAPTDIAQLHVLSYAMFFLFLLHLGILV